MYIPAQHERPAPPVWPGGQANPHRGIEPGGIRSMRRTILLALVLGASALASGPAVSQESANYKVREYALNAGGHPEGGFTLASPSFKIRLDAIGDGITGAGLSGPSWRMDAGFTSGYPPPGEVSGVQFNPAGVSLLWNPERSVGTYSLYRGILRQFLPTYGICSQYDLINGTATDPDVAVVGAGYFYFVTVRNRLGEEGTKGFNSAGTERSNPSPCP